MCRGPCVLLFINNEFQMRVCLCIYRDFCELISEHLCILNECCTERAIRSIYFVRINGKIDEFNAIVCG